MTTFNITECQSRLNTPHPFTMRPLHSGGGLGNATEALFGIVENNRQGADHEESGTEFKTKLEDTTSLVTLVTCNPNENYIRKGGSVRMLTEDHAVQTTQEDRKNFYFSVRVGKATDIGGQAFTISREADRLLVLQNGYAVCGWTKQRIDNALTKKLTRLMLAKATSKALDPSDPRYAELAKGGEPRLGEWKAVSLYEGFSHDRFWDRLDAGRIMIDFRSHSLDVGKASLKIRDHGTAFRITEREITDIYTSMETQKII